MTLSENFRRLIMNNTALLLIDIQNIYFTKGPLEYYEPLEHCLGSLEQVKSKGWSRTEPAPIF